MSSNETIFANARVVTQGACFPGHVVVRDGMIAEVGEGPMGGGSKGGGALGGSGIGASLVDCGGDYLLPGLVELHTDNLERHMTPRPGLRWPAAAAVLAHDARLAMAGITTVLDAIALGDTVEDGHRLRDLDEMAESLERAREIGALRIDHLLHLRCEVSYGAVVELLERYSTSPALRLVSVMDHTPGQRQFVSYDKYRQYYQGKYRLSDQEMAALIERQAEAQRRHSQPNRKNIVALCRARGIALASHDDGTIEQVAEAAADGMAIAEFPTTEMAAAASRERGLSVLMGAPNVVRGGSHSGNIAASTLAAAGLLDILSSDYVPHSLLHAAMLLPEAVPGITLPQAVASVTATPAAAIGLRDRGAIAAGLRADVIRVDAGGPSPRVAEVWVRGARVV